jgi:serine/threonine-protein kinase
VVTPRVTFLNLDGFRCGSGYDTVATVTVQTDGAADVTLTLSWIHKTARTVGNPVAATQTVVIPKGSTTVRADYPHVFGSNDPNPIWAVQVATGPAAERSRTTYAQLGACIPLR